MEIHAGFQIALSFQTETPLMALLSVHPSRSQDIINGRGLETDPPVPIDWWVDGFGNRCARLVAQPGRMVFQDDFLIKDSGMPDPRVTDAQQHPVQDLPTEVLQFLLQSRYCEVDGELNNLAWEKFASIEGGWSRVQAICDFVYGHLRFDYNAARANRTAAEAYREQVGVCRDFMHLAITLCRCLNIPARYATGFLGDIGIPPVPLPMDFSAWFEVYLGGQWHTFDARHNEPRIGRILMAHGRDAADVALTTTFGPHRLDSFKVWTDEVAERDEKPLPVVHSDAPRFLAAGR